MTNANLTATLRQIKILVDDALRGSELQIPPEPHKHKPPSSTISHASEIDFSKPIRPFMKVYSSGLSGPKKFVLLLARLSGGEITKEVNLSEIQEAWNRMTVILQMEFNRFFPSQAKDRDWVESKKKGLYNLRPDWRDALKGKS